MMKKTMMGVVLLCTLASSAFAVGGTGYIWISTGGEALTYDEVSYVNPETAYSLKVDKAKGLPNINSIIRIEPKNRLYHNFTFIQDISKEFMSLMINKQCENTRGSFGSFMLNQNKECSVDNVIEQIKKEWYNKNESYYDFKHPVKAKVLGYVEFRVGVFVFVQVMEVIKEEKKDK